MKASDLFVKCLEEEGVEIVFGVPGEENADFIRSLSQSKKITFVLTRHEQGAAFMAEVYGRLTGRAAGCLGTLGPGATNLTTGVADANMDRAPLLALTGQGGTYRLHKESHQIMDVVGMFRPITKWATSVYNADSIPEIIRKAVRVATSEKPGAVHIELPEDIAKAKTDARPIPPHKFRRPAADEKALARAIALLKTAKHPIILAGNGTVRKRTSKQLRIFCEHTSIGVINTFMAKGAVDMDAPYSLFTIGLGARDWPAIAIAKSDVVIAIGFDMVEYHPRLWNADDSAQIIHIDYTPSEIDTHYCPKAEVVGDVSNTLWRINEHIANEALPAYDLKYQQQVRDRMQDDFAEHAKSSKSGALLPQKVLWDAREAMGGEDILLSDVGAHKMWIARYYQCHEPNTCLIPNGFCSMGFALPGAIAAHYVFPKRKILAICGDGGFMMNVQEMETAARLKSRIVVMVWEDKMYGLIAWKQTTQFGDHTPLSFTNPDWNLLGHAFGWHVHHVGGSGELAPKLRAAFAEEGPSLIVVPIDYSENMKLNERLGEVTCDL